MSTHAQTESFVITLKYTLPVQRTGHASSTIYEGDLWTCIHVCICIYESILKMVSHIVRDPGPRIRSVRWPPLSDFCFMIGIARKRTEDNKIQVYLVRERSLAPK